MKKIVSGTDMKKVDSYTINTIGIPSLVLMERAALSVTDIIEHNESKDKKVLVIAGTGNNGADGLAVCRMLHLKGYQTCIYIVGDISQSTEEFKCQYSILRNLNIKAYNSDEFNLGQVGRESVLVDAVFGVGLSRNVEGEHERVIDVINDSNAPIYAVDIPSGVNADNGYIMKKAVKADYTISFGSLKIGEALYPGTEYCGIVSIADIGFPDEAYNGTDILKYHTVEDKKKIPRRANYSNKGSFGKVLVVAGSRDISGAAFMCGKAAFRVGAGLVRIFTAKENKEAIQKLLPEAMLNIYDSDNFDLKSFEASLNWSDIVAIGPGLSTGGIQKQMVEMVLESRKKTVIDADGINVISQNEALKKKLHKNVILTPHLAEMSRLLNVSVEEISKNLIKYAREIDYRFNAGCILKDARTVAATHDETYINLTGNNGMATAGSGDVLTGITAGLLSIGMSIGEATTMAPYLHGMAGDLAAEKMPKASIMATDIIGEIKNCL